MILLIEEQASKDDVGIAAKIESKGHPGTLPGYPFSAASEPQLSHVPWVYPRPG